MKDALKSRKEIQSILKKAPQAALFLDFDGTLAPIVRDSTKAAMSEDMRFLVQKLAERMHVFIVTGRALKDIRSRAPLKDVEYAGNHGLEWTRAGKIYRGKISAATMNDLRDALKASTPLQEIAGTFIEDKKYSISFHYRNVASSQIPEFMRLVKKILWPIVARGRTEILEQKKIIEIRMRGVHKGEFVTAALKRLPKGTVGIYIGDDTTDEDAFKALADGVTIRVNEKTSSAAKYFVDDQKSVAALLEHLII